MDPVALIPYALGGLAGGGVVWLAMTASQLRREIAELRRRAEIERLSSAAAPHTHNGGALAGGTLQALEHRAQLLSVAALVKLAARDNLDALIRVSPEMADEVLRELAPHLFNEDETEHD